MILAPEPLTVEAFQPFGEVVAADDRATHYTINAGNTERYHDLMTIRAEAGGRPILNIFRYQPRQFPFKIAMLERHPLGSQCFIPLTGARYLAVVAASRGDGHGPLRLFLGRGDQGINLAPNIWHHPLLVLDGGGDFLVIDRSGPGENCDEITLPEPFLVEAL